jgi:hypothetical protein
VSGGSPQPAAPLTDDRGRPAGLLDWESLDPRNPTEDLVRRLARRASADATKDPRSLVVGAAGCLLKGALGATVLLALFGVLRWIGAPPAMGTLPAVILMAGAVLLRHPLERGINRFIERRVGLNNAREIAHEALDSALCPACGYSMRDLPIDPDGCVLCPECGAAWRESRMGRREGRTHGGR